MATINLKFENKPNESLKPGDIAFYTSTSASNSFTVNSGTAKRLGVVRSIKHVSETGVLPGEVTSSNNLLNLSSLGSELVKVNNTFTTDLTGWTATATGWTNSGDKAKYESGTQNSKLYQEIETELGSVYKVSVEVSGITGSATMDFGLSNGGTASFYVNTTVSTNGTYFLYALANATNHRFQLQNNTQAGSFLVDNVSVKKLSTPDYWIVNVDIPATVADPNVNDYIYFSKDTSANFNGVTGYFAETKMSNSKTSQAELYAVNFEVIESSK